MEQTVKARQQAYYQANRDKIRAYYKEWYQKNKDTEHLKERIKLTNAIYLANKKQYISEYKRRYYLENMDYITHYRREYQEKNKDRIAERAKELRRYHRCKSSVTSRHCVSLDFETGLDDVIIEEIKITNSLQKHNPVAPYVFAAQRSVSLSFD